MKKKTKNRVLRFFKFLYLKLIGINDSPQKIAAGFGLGVFLGILPVTGPIAALFLAFVLRLNRISALLGSILTNTWLSVLTFFLSIKAGSAIMNLNWQEVNSDWVRFLKDFHFLNLFKLSTLKLIFPVIVGYFIIAFCIAAAMYLVILTMLKLFKKRQKERRDVVMNNHIKMFFILFTALLFLTGCATYRFEHGRPPYDKGYVVSRNDRTILEYTLGENNTVPGIKLAKERFNRRKRIVEDYYKRIGLVQNHFAMVIWEPTITFWKMVGGVFRLPFIAISDYRYEHNPKYRERIRQLEAERDMRETEHKNKLKEELNKYIQTDFKKEQLPTEQQTEEPRKTVTLNVPDEQQAVAQEKPLKEEHQEHIEHQTQEFLQTEGLKAVIIAKPIKGYSPLKVRFNSRASTSKQEKIVSYHWDFGDGTSSTKPNPVNRYWSTSYGSRYFTAVLTIKDQKGNLASSSVVIEVLTK